MSNTPPKNDAKEVAARKKVVRNLTVSGIIIVLAILAGLWSTLRNDKGTLIVTSRPQGAEVVLNQRPTNLVTNAFFAGLPADSFIVSVRMDGFRPVPPDRGVSLSANDTTRVTFLLAPISREDPRELPKDTGRPYRWAWRHVRMNSEPQGAEVVLDDKKTGLITPCDFLFEAGEHHLQAHWPNGAKAYKNITIHPSVSRPEVLFRPATYLQPETLKPEK
ncbi:PEGA domain-containing protein [bacterium]|nr:PEGA domain-containing protein [bacterium]